MPAITSAVMVIHSRLEDVNAMATEYKQMCHVLLAYGVEMKSAGPRRKRAIPLIKNPLTINFLVP